MIFSFDALFAVYNVANEIEDIIAEPTRTEEIGDKIMSR